MQAEIVNLGNLLRQVDPDGYFKEGTHAAMAAKQKGLRLFNKAREEEVLAKKQKAEQVTCLLALDIVLGIDRIRLAHTRGLSGKQLGIAGGLSLFDDINDVQEYCKSKQQVVIDQLPRLNFSQHCETVLGQDLL